MATTDTMPPLTSGLPVITYGVSVQDANGNDLLADIAGAPGPVFSFTLANLQSQLGTTPSSSDTLVAGLLTAIKTFFQGFDWGTYASAAIAQASAPTPVSFKSVTVTQWDASTTSVTP